MKNIKFLIPVVTIVLLCSFAPADWINFISKEGRFSQMFPKQPTPSVQNEDAGGMKLKMHLFIYDATKYKDDNQAYITLYCDYPKDMVSSDFREELVDTMFKTSVEGMAESMKGKILSVDKATYKSFPGRKVKLDVGPGQGFAYINMFLVNSRMYMLEVLCTPDKDKNAAMAKFFDSFTIAGLK